MSTKHPEIGEWMAYLDGESGSGSERLAKHLAACGECSQTFVELRGSSDLFTQAMATLDPLSMEVEGALVAVKATRHVPAARSTVGHRNWWSRPLARAAAVILAFGALASGLPGSPVRAWLQERSQPNSGAVVPDVIPETPAGDPGVRLAPVNGRARVNVQGLEETGEIVVRIVDEQMVSVYATEGASFATDAGRVLVTQAGGQVMIEFPRTVRDGAVEVAGEVIFRKIGNEIQIRDGQRAPLPTDEIRVRP